MLNRPALSRPGTDSGAGEPGGLVALMLKMSVISYFIVQDMHHW